MKMKKSRLIGICGICLLVIVVIAIGGFLISSKISSEDNLETQLSTTLQPTITQKVSTTIETISKMQTTTTQSTSSKIQPTTTTQPVLELGKKVPEASFTTIEGKERKLSAFKNKKIMLWFIATWCPSCGAGAKVLEENNQKLTNLTIIALKSYGNLGYPGPSIAAFAQKNAPKTLNYENWVWGEASQESTKIYNPRNYPDVYYLIDEKGRWQKLGSSPAATINKIANFARE